MVKLLLILIACSSITNAQLFLSQQSKTILDTYYGNLLIPDDSLQLLTDKVFFPGFKNDSTSNVAVGYLPNNYMEIPVFLSDGTYVANSNFRSLFSNYYGWTDKMTSVGKIGVWAGNIGISDSYSRNPQNKTYNEYYSGRTALWYNPINTKRLKGVSLEIGGVYSGNKNEYLYNSTGYTTASGSASIGITTLTEITKDTYLRFRFAGMHNSSQNTRTSLTGNYSYYGNYNYSTTTDTTKDNINEGSIYIGMVQGNGAQAGLSVMGSSNTTNSNYAGVTLEGSYGKKVHYGKHALTFGCNGTLGYTASTFNKPNVWRVRHAVNDGNISANATLQLPCIIDVNIPGSNLFVMIGTTPVVYGSFTKRPVFDSDEKYRNVHLTTENISFGLRGKIGNKIDIAIIPSIQSNVFFTGLEVRYSL